MRTWLGLLCAAAVSALICCDFGKSPNDPVTVNTTPVFPAAQWQKSTPEEQGVDSKIMEEALDFLDRISGYNQSDCGVIIRHGYVIHEGLDADYPQWVWSATKSFVSTVLGKLIDEGKCSLTTLAKDIVPYLDTAAHDSINLSNDYSRVTIRHFATMTSGYTSLREPAGDSAPWVPGYPQFEPGAKFEYGKGGNMNMLAYILTKIAGKSLYDYFKEKIADPIGIDPARWNWGNYGVVDGVAINGGAGIKEKGVRISPLDIARFGWLMCRMGEWNGQQIISREWVAQALAPQVDASIEYNNPTDWYGVGGENLAGAYGYNFWVNGVQKDGARKWPNAPEYTAAMQGNMNNLCFIIPEWDMVIVRLGDDKVINIDLYDLFFNRLKKGVTL
jgi:CubicO group peptidase (beta-lactamase class C family)